MAELIPVNVVIADRSYRLRIEPADEEMVRKTVKLINDKILEFKTNFAGKDMQDYIAMVLIWYATQITAGTVQKDDTALLKALQKLDEQVTELLPKEKEE